MKKIFFLLLIPCISFAQSLGVVNTSGTIISSTSTEGLNYTDLSASNGEVGIRLLKGLTPNWLLRNRDTDDYFDIAEAGITSRFLIQKNTGNIGIGITPGSPGYKLDVLHAGNTGMRLRSSISYSILDIDAANGDASIRFLKADVGKWNVRNRPADDYFEIYEMDNGGSRLVIQDGTGNVGIGEVTEPLYKLDVLHNGASGVRVRSIASSSVIDIDAASGDAGLRFLKANQGRWTIRNNPVNDNLQIYELGSGERMRIENATGNVVVNGNLSKGGGSFKIDHPLDPENKYLSHSFVESPDMMNIYNGNIKTDASGIAKVKLPDYFEALNMEFRYQLTVIGSFAQAIVSEEIDENSFVIATDKPHVKVSWQVTGVRKDAFAKNNRIPNVELKIAEERGKYLHPKAFGKPESMGVWYTDKAEKARSNGLASSIDYAPMVSKINPATESIAGASGEQKPVKGPQSTDNN